MLLFSFMFLILYTMDVILDELQYNDVDIDMKTLSHHITYVNTKYNDLISEMKDHVSENDICDIFQMTKINNFGRAMIF